MLKDITDKRVLTELYSVFFNSDDDVKKCIPLDIIEYVKNNMDMTYDFYLEDGKDLNNQDLLYETRKAIAWIYKEYISPTEYIKLEPIKIKENMFEENISNNEINENVLPVMQESWYQKVYKLISNLFKR